jgi:hypothetical protein
VVEQQREDLGSIAKYFGIGDWKVIWEDPQNQALRKKRKSPASLRRGDRVVLPPPEVHELVRSSDSSQTIEVRPVEPLVRQKWSM